MKAFQSYIKFFAIVSFMFFLMACKSEDVIEEPILNIAESSINCTSDSSTKNIYVTTNLDQWDVKSSAPDWCMVTRKNQKNPYILVFIKENRGIESRECTITVSGGTKPLVIAVKQLGSAPGIILSSDFLDFDSEASSQKVSVMTNIENITYSIDPLDINWLSCEKDEEEHSYTITVLNNEEFVKREALITFEGELDNDKKISTSLSVVQKELSGEAEDVKITKDIKITPTKGIANQFQPGQNIENTFDGKFGEEGAPYHSPWGDGTSFPIILEYFFEDNPDQIDYLIYYSRSGNGNFGKFNLYIATEDDPEYSLYDEYDFKEKNSPSRITFKGGLFKPIKIKFEILSGLGGFASCDEMEFYKRNTENPLELNLLSVFTDLTCSELKANVSDLEIKKLPLFFGNIATQLQNKTYEKEFRIASYPAYSNTEEWAEKLIINPRNVLDNCTGIYAEGGKEIIILVGDTHGNEVGLRSIKDTEYFGDDYFLHEGVNKITPRNTGLLYIMYTVSDLSNPSAKAIDIHIPMGCGTVNGYWDINNHKTDAKYQELLAKATYEYFEVKGTDIMLKFPTVKFREFIPQAIIPSIQFWDKMVQIEQSIMGWEGIYPKKMNNRMYARSTKEGYMSAQSYMTNFAENILYKILSPEKMLENEDNPWGPAHEIGHMNQGAINWVGNTETSNNLFSNLVRHKMTSFPSRGESIAQNVQALMVEKRVFTTVGDANNPYDYGNVGYCSLRMNWQLYCYFHWLKNDECFFPNLFKLSRKDGRRPIGNNPGWSQLNFVKNACDAAQLNLLEFFDFWGFLRPIDINIHQYYPAHLLVTQAMIDETIQYVNSKGYKKPKYPIQYIEDREDSQYGDVGKISQIKKQNIITNKITYSLAGNRVTINQGSQAIGFEVYINDELKFFSNQFNFTIPEEIFSKSCNIYAVQSDGERILLER